MESRLDQQAQEMESGFTEARAEHQAIMEDLGYVKGIFFEQNVSKHAPAIFGRYLKRGRDVTGKILELAQEAADEGKISDAQYNRLAFTDILWGGKVTAAQAELVLVIEVSWKAGTYDIERVVEAVKILRSIGLQALPVVAAKEWTEATKELAARQGVVQVTDRLVDRNSWERALTFSE